FFFSSRRRHTRWPRDWSSDVCSSDLVLHAVAGPVDADSFLREARWANETYQLAQLEKPTPAQLQTFFRQAHLARLKLEREVSLRSEERRVGKECRSR